MLNIEITLVSYVALHPVPVLILLVHVAIVMNMEPARRNARHAISLMSVTFRTSTAARIVTAVSDPGIDWSTDAVLNCLEEVLMDVEVGREEVDERRLVFGYA